MVRTASETVECPTHFAYALAAGRERKTGAETALIRVLRDEKTSAVVRASAASLLGDFNTIPSVQASLFEALKSPSELIRTTSVHALEGSFHTEAECLARLLPLLNDPVRSVRLEAVRQMTGLPIPSSFHNAYRNALKEYRTSLDNLPERPESHLNYGILYERTRNPKQAEAAYRRALTLSAAYFPARNNLGMLLYAQGRKAEAETEFRELVRQTSERADSWYSLGLLLSESPQTLRGGFLLYKKRLNLRRT